MSLFTTLTSVLDEEDLSELVAETAKAAQWAPEFIARWSAALGADPAEIQVIISEARTAHDDARGHHRPRL